jgi:hypothetical protein
MPVKKPLNLSKPKVNRNKERSKKIILIINIKSRKIQESVELKQGLKVMNHSDYDLKSAAKSED